MRQLRSVARALVERSTAMNATIQVHPRQRLVTERLRRRWTQQEVAEQLGTTPGNVSRWERGITSPGPYFRSRLCELFGRSARELGLTWDESDDTRGLQAQASVLAASFLRDALARNHPAFADNENLLAQVRTLLRPETTAALSSVSANSGIGDLNLPEQESLDQARLAQAVAHYLQKLILDNMGAVVFVVL